MPVESDKTARTTGPIHRLMAERWSPIAFDVERPVEREKLISIFEAARWAPSCFNEQPWRYLICDRFSDAESWENALECLVPGNQRWASSAPVLIAAISSGAFARNGKENRWGNYDTGAASVSMCLQASDMGLAIHQMGGFDAAKVIRTFAIPDGHDPIAMMALGYPGSVDELSDADRERELEIRQRKNIESFAFLNSWGAGLSDD